MSPVTPTPSGTGPTFWDGAIYTDPDAVRGELAISATILPDAAAIRLIAKAENLIDQQLGARWVDENTGRKVVQADVDGWRWQKLADATTYLAARIYTHPDLLEQRFTSLSGPDFSHSGPIGPGLITNEIDALLNASGLRRLGGRARGGPAYRGWRGTLMDDGSWDDEPAWTGSGPSAGMLG